MGEKGERQQRRMGKGRKGGGSEGGVGERVKGLGRGKRRNGMGIRGRRDWDIRKGNLKERVWGMVFREQIAYIINRKCGTRLGYSVRLSKCCNG